jgi:2-polyprenyl-3-methyl-5-hydroxy-6-metoxy-1,4-benzoquinol methylase
VLFKQQGYDSYLAKVFSKPPAEDLNWVVCTDCGFVYRTPVLEDNELSMLYRNYDKDIFLNTTPDAYFEKIVSLSNDESENWQKVEWLGNILSKHKLFDTCKSVLDVGCGGGTLLYTIKQQLEVEKVCGVELNSAYADLASTKLNADIKNENYKSGLFKDKFDLIVNTKVLEHVSDPLPFLQEIENDLGEEGVFFIEVPDISDMYNLPPNHERFFIPHIYFFSTKSLSTLLEKSGFNVIEKRVVKTSRNRAYLQILAIKKSEKISKTILDTVNDNYTEIRRRVKENIEQHNAN